MSKEIKSKKQKDIVYPVFQECCKYFKDEFWIKLFDDLSRSKCPKGVMIYNSVISSTYKRNGFTYNFSEQSPEIIIKELPILLNNSVHIYSNKDIINREADINIADSEYLNAKETDDWKKVKNRKMKENLVTNYCLAMKKKFKLKYKDAKHLYDMLKYSLFDLKIQKSNDVEMKNGEIFKIQDIEYDKTLKQFVNKRFNNCEENEDEKEQVNILQLKWKNYVSTIIKEVAKYEAN
jgi:hypothetical protein